MDPFTVLGVARHANLEAVRAAFREQMRQCVSTSGVQSWEFFRLRNAYEEILRSHERGPDPLLEWIPEAAEAPREPTGRGRKGRRRGNSILTRRAGRGPFRRRENLRDEAAALERRRQRATLQDYDFEPRVDPAAELLAWLGAVLAVFGTGAALATLGYLVMGTVGLVAGFMVGCLYVEHRFDQLYLYLLSLFEPGAEGEGEEAAATPNAELADQIDPAAMSGFLPR